MIPDQPAHDETMSPAWRAAEGSFAVDCRGRSEAIAGSGSLVVVSSRLPVSWDEQGPGSGRWRESPGGLATALTSAFAARPATWIGWAGTSGAPPARVPASVGSADLSSVELSARDVQGYYRGFCNATLWPLLHDLPIRSVPDPRDWDAYCRVNAAFAAETSCRAPRGATVWVHDYQMMLVPQMLRNLRPDLRIGFFLHTPFPRRQLAAAHQHAELVRGVLGADVAGFQTSDDVRAFSEAAASVEPAIPTAVGVRLPDRHVRLGAFPISVDANHLMARGRDAAINRHARQIRKVLGAERTIFLGVDRLDYTKGIATRLRAFRALIMDRSLPAGAAFVQVSVPSRTGVAGYAQVQNDVEREIEQLRQLGLSCGRHTVHHIRRSLPPDELAALYVAADVMCVTPERDGMNLVAKEFVAVKQDTGALVLSTGAGAARELRAAWLVDGRDVHDVKRGLLAATRSDHAERRTRMAAMSDYLREHDVRRWAGTFLRELEVCHV